VLPAQELAEELGIYLLYFDRAGYGDSDANQARGLKSDATDVEELADALQLGDKFYVVGLSLGGYTAWSCLHYIPHRSGTIESPVFVRMGLIIVLVVT
jgi:pimeloyl-ACP methyl ester carboxylesterase